MATIPSEIQAATLAPEHDTRDTGHAERRGPKRAPQPVWLQALEMLASLKLTVTLFALSIALIYIGTVAQAEKDMWEVIRDYFRCYFAWVDFRILFPQSFFPTLPRIPGGFYFPGGATIGGLLALNLVSAHLVRFKIQATGSRLAGGLAVVAAGILVTWYVIVSGHNRDGLQGLPFIEMGTLWVLLKLSLVGAFVGTLIAFFNLDKSRKIERWTLVTVSALVGGLVLFLLVRGDDAMLSSSSLRILWHLIQAELAALVLLAGCNLLFKRRGGIVVIHLGVGLLMFCELLVARTAVEEQMQIMEGKTVNFARDIRQVELVFEDTSDPNFVEFVAIPEELLQAESVITNENLPFAVTPIEYLRNSTLSDKTQPNRSNPATAGVGKELIANRMRPVAGTDGGAVNVAATYVRIAPKDNPTGGDVYMLSQLMGDGELFQGRRADEPEKITSADGKTYNVYLRYRRNYKPYAVTLKNVVAETYKGVPTPRDYASYITLAKADQEPVESKIWMNNPMRYAGETFYQQSYSRDRFGEWTTLQVVANVGWMVPYVACMIVATGMMGHFGGTLSRFLNRYYKAQDPNFAATATTLEKSMDDASQRAGKKKKPREAVVASRDDAWITWGTIAGVLLLATAWLASGFFGKSKDVEGIDLTRFGEIPVLNAGRVMPMSTVARTALATISNKTSITHKTEDSKQRISATQWLLEMAIQTKQVDDYQVFRIENLDVQRLFGLERRKGFKYSYNELRPQLEADLKNSRFDAAYREAVELSRQDEGALSPMQRKLLELAQRVREYRRIRFAFTPMPFPDDFSQEKLAANKDKMNEMLEKVRATMERIPEYTQMSMELGSPRLMLREQPKEKVGQEESQPASILEEQILPYGVGVTQAYPLRMLLGQTPPEPLQEFAALLDAYDRGSAEEFQTHTEAYLALVKKHAPAEFADHASQTRIEALLNKAQPFMKAQWLYFAAFGLTCVGWLGARQVMNRTAFWLLLLVFAVHTIAYILRMYASGRPPVTNLYSSALFIAWGCVGIGLVFEAIYRLSIGNLVAGVCGFLSLMIAGFLETLGGDTMPVMQAVLDTQFWLTTHVVCVSTGYLATFVAGFLGIAYVLCRFFSPDTLEVYGKEFSRMIYGTVCFAAFFSLVGTVLGGLWADDSWGRFWGWDPKENGALIIVIWNALILHARWGGMVKDRGLAVLAVIGNIATSWSWFGVNELGIGLHSYGFTEGVKMYLGIFWITNAVIILLAFLQPRPIHGSRSVEYSR